MNSLTKDQWREVCRICRPEWTDADFEAYWNDFTTIKDAVMVWREKKRKFNIRREFENMNPRA